MCENNTKPNLIQGLQEDFEKIQGTKNLFPNDVFPIDIQLIIREVDDKLGFPADYFGAAILYAASVAIGNKIKLKMKESWLETTSMYLVIVGRTGDAKSHAISLALKPLQKIDSDNYKEYKLKLSEYNKAISQGENSKKPTYKQLLINDSTSEALIKAMHINKRGIGIRYDEIRGFIKSFGLYKNGSNDEELILTLWSGKTVVKNRVSEDALLIKNTKLDIIGSIQEKMIAKTFNGNKIENGFTERFLFAIPLKYRNVKWNKNSINPTYIDEYEQSIHQIFEYSEQIEFQKIIEFQKDAYDYLIEWQNNLSTEFDFDYERAIEVKLQEYTLRFALLIQVISDVAKNKPVENIDLDSVQKAIQLFEYFRFNAIKVREIMNKDYLDGLSDSQQKAYNALPQTFMTKEAKDILLQKRIMKERNIHYFLKDFKLFKKIAHGQYEKIYSI
ncbi:MAG: DUF3987 domain-containing protein [Weeksellaceae bacterium]